MNSERRGLTERAVVLGLVLVVAASVFGLAVGTVAAQDGSANFEVEIDSTNSPVTEGENLTFMYTVTNTGDENGTQTIVGRSPDVPDSDPRSPVSGELFLEAGESISVGVDTPPVPVSTGAGDAGEYEVIIESEDDKATTSVTVEESTANFEVSIDSTNSPVTEGENLSLTYTITNTDSEVGSQVITGRSPDLPDSDPRSPQSGVLTLNGGESVTTTAEVPTNDGDAGEYDVIIETENDTATTPVTVEEPTSNFDVTIDGTNSPVPEGESLEVAATIENTGRQQDTQTITAKAGSLGSDDTVRTLGADESVNVTFSIPTNDGDAGEYDVTVESQEDTATTSVTVAEVNITRYIIDPFPVEKGETPEVVVEVENASNVQVEVNGERADMNNPSGNTWKKEISPLLFPVDDEMGERVELRIIASNGADTLSKIEDAYPRTQLPGGPDTEPGTERLHYYIFDDVVDVPVVLAKFKNQDPAEFGFGTSEAVHEWELAREYDINTHMGSGRGSSGSIGYDLIYYDNGTDFHTVNTKSSYMSDDGFSRDDFIEDAQSESRISLQRGVATHLGSGASRAGVIRFSGQIKAYMDMRPKEMSKGSDHYGVWIHELSHLYLGRDDLYKDEDVDVDGDIGKAGIMGKGYGFPPNPEVERGEGKLPSSYSVLSKTKLNNGGPDSVDEADLPWAKISESDIGGDNIRDVGVIVKRVDEYGDGVEDLVPVLSTNKTGQNGTIKYLFEGHVDEDKVRGYRIVVRNPLLDSPELEYASLFTEEVDNSGSYVKEGQYTKFTVDQDGVGQDEFVVTAEYTSKPLSTTAAITGSVDYRLRERPVGAAPNVTTPDLDLRAVDSQGRVTGVNGQGEFINEIPGAEASGDTTGFEWINVPNDADVEFEVSSADVQKFMNETGVSEENITGRYSTSIARSGSNTEVVMEDGEPTVTNTTTKMVTDNETIDPGQTEDAVKDKLIAGFSSSLRKPNTSETVRFNASLSTDFGGTIQSYSWDFGDGTTATGETAAHSYSSSGNYTVTLTVTNDEGETDTATQTVNVQQENLFPDPIPGTGFENPPRNMPSSQSGFDDNLYEDLDGDGDTSDVGPTVRVFGQLIRDEDLGLKDEQARALDWNPNSPETEVTPADMVSLFGEQIRAD